MVRTNVYYHHVKFQNIWAYNKGGDKENNM